MPWLRSTISVMAPGMARSKLRSEEHTSELQSPCNLVCRLLLEKKKTNDNSAGTTHTSSAPRATSRKAGLMAQVPVRTGADRIRLMASERIDFIADCSDATICTL